MSIPEEDFDFGEIPGVDPDAVAPDGVDPSKSDDCESGACKI